MTSRPEQVVSNLDEQFDMFFGIAELYLQPTSPQEVNISSQMQTKIALLKDKERFSELDEDSRRHVLQEPLEEIVRVLEQNLLIKFEQSPGMTKRRESIERHNMRESGIP